MYKNSIIDGNYIIDDKHCYLKKVFLALINWQKAYHPTESHIPTESLQTP